MLLISVLLFLLFISASIVFIGIVLILKQNEEVDKLREMYDIQQHSFIKSMLLKG